MSNDESRSVAESLNPAQFAVHVTRTTMLLEQMSKDLQALRTETEISIKSTETLRGRVSDMERDTAVHREATLSRVSANETLLKELDERLRWLGRLVIGALITGTVGGILAFVFRTIR